MTERCETCRYWRKAEELRNLTVMACQRYNDPQPITPWNRWCGEWRERERDPMDVTQR